MPYIGTGVPNRALTSADIAQGAVTLDDISFTDQPTNLNILGTIDKHTMRLTDGVTVTGDVTLSDNLIFAKLSDDGNAITLTDDGSTRTITGTGSIEASTLAQTPNSSLTGMTGELGSVVTGSPNLNLTTGLANANTEFPTGHVIQTSGDSYTRTAGFVIGTGSLHVFGADLETSLTPKSMDNYLVTWLTIPGYSNEGTGNSLKLGLRYSTDSFSSSDVTLGPRNNIDEFIYHNATTSMQGPLTWCLWTPVPTTSAIKIRVITQAYNAAIQLFVQAGSTGNPGVASIVTQEIQG